jgi:hypothetical protein
MLIGRGDFDAEYEVDEDAEPIQVWDDVEKTYIYQQPLVPGRPRKYDAAFSNAAERECEEGREERIHDIAGKPLRVYLSVGCEKIGISLR